MLSGLQLLTVLDPDPQKAEEKYVELFYKLARFFEWNRVEDPEGLAQESIARAFQRLSAGQVVHVDPVAYFFGFARNVLREHRRRRRLEPVTTEDIPLPAFSFAGLNANEGAVLLQECLDKLSEEDSALLLSYVDDDEAALQRWNLSPGALRVRVHRIRKYLEMHLLRATGGKKEL